MLDELGVKAFKVATYELRHLPLIREIASRGKPIICSTGMADLADVQVGGGHGRATGNDQLILLHCVVNYPPPFSDLNLRAIETMHRAFGVPVGWSDHTPCWLAPVIATALGAAVVEKHFTTDRDSKWAGPSLRARPRRAAGDGPRDSRQGRSLGERGQADGPSRRPTSMSRPDGRYSPLRPIAVGTVVTGEADVAILRPGTGIEVRDLPKRHRPDGAEADRAS